MSRIARNCLALAFPRFTLGALLVTVVACGAPEGDLGPQLGEGDAAAADDDAAPHHEASRPFEGSLDDIRGDGAQPLASPDRPDDAEALGTEVGEEEEEEEEEEGEEELQGDGLLGEDELLEEDDADAGDGLDDGERVVDEEDEVVDEEDEVVEAPDEGPDDDEGDALEDDADAPPPTSIVLLIAGTAVEGEMFDTMAGRLAEGGYEPVVWEAPDRLTDGLVLGAERIGDAIADVLADRAPGERLHVVAECNGGVAARYWLQHLADPDERARVDQFVTFVSAHHGTWLSPGGWFTGWQSLRDVKPHSRFMADLNSTALPEDLAMTSIYTCRDEFFLPDDTARVEGAVNVEFCDRRLRHFDTFTDSAVHARITAALRGEGAAAGMRF